MSSSLGSTCSCWHLSALKWPQSSLSVTSLSSMTRSPCSSCVVPVPDRKSASSPRSDGPNVLRTIELAVLICCLHLSLFQAFTRNKGRTMWFETRIRYIMCPSALISPAQVQDQMVLCLALWIGSIGPPSEEAWLWKNWASSFFRKGGKRQKWRQKDRWEFFW